MTDEHLSRLAEWLLRTIGQALGMSMLIGFFVSIVLAIAGEDLVLAVAAVPITFAIVLARAEAPRPRAAKPDTT